MTPLGRGPAAAPAGAADDEDDMVGGLSLELAAIDARADAGGCSELDTTFDSRASASTTALSSASSSPIRTSPGHHFRGADATLRWAAVPKGRGAASGAAGAADRVGARREHALRLRVHHVRHDDARLSRFLRRGCQLGKRMCP